MVVSYFNIYRILFKVVTKKFERKTILGKRKEKQLTFVILS